MQKIINTRLFSIRALNTPARASLLYAVAAAITKGAALLFTPIFTRLFSVSEYGSLSLFSSYASVLSLFSSLEIGGGVIWKLFGKARDRINGLFKSALFVTVLSSCLSFFVFLLVATAFKIEMPFTFTLPIIFLCSLFGSLNRLALAREKYFYRYRAIIYLALAEGFLPSVIALVIYFASGYISAEIKVAAGAATAAVFFLCLIYVMLKRGELTSEGGRLFKDCRDILKAALPMLPYYISLLCLSSFDKLIIGNSLDKEKLAVYTIGHSAGLVLSFLTGAVSQALYPWIMRKLSLGNTQRVMHLSFFFSLTVAATTAAYSTLIPEIIGILAPSTYNEAREIAYILSLSVLPLFLSGITNCISLYKTGSSAAVISGIISAVLSVLLNLLVTPRLGILAAAIICLASYTMLFAISSLILWIKSRFTPINVYNYLQISLFCALISGLSYMFKGVLLIRILILSAVLVFLTIMLLKNRKLIFEK